MADKKIEINSVNSTNLNEKDKKNTKDNKLMKVKQGNQYNKLYNSDNKNSTNKGGGYKQGNRSSKNSNMNNNTNSNTNNNTNNNTYKKNNHITSRNDKKVNWLLAPLIFIITVIPLIVKMKIFNPHLMQYNWFPDINEEIDCFLYYKQSLLVGMLIIMILIVTYKLYIKKHELRFSPVFIPLGIYAVLSLLSAIFSDNPSLSFWGSRDQFESIFAIIGYCMIVFYAYQYINTVKDVKTIIKWLLTSVFILSLIGLSQFVGHDFFATDFAVKLITSIEGASLDFIFEKGRVYLTLYNPNYVGVYVALVAPIFLILLLFSKKLINSLLYLLALIGLAICMIGSLSLTGIVGIAMAFIGTLIFMWRYILKRYYVTVPVFFVLLIALFIINKQTDNLMFQRIQEIYHFDKIEKNLTNITTYDDHVSITYKRNTMNIEFIVDKDSASYFTIVDGNGLAINNTFDSTTNSFIIQDDRFLGITFTPVIYRDYLSFDVNIEGKDWLFTNQTEDGTYYYHTNHGKLDKLITAPQVGFQGYESYASGRGYIWSRTLPLIKDYIFLGSGPDTYIAAFPQQDYLGLYNSSFEGSYLTKPHNLYLQIAIQTGLLSLIAFLVFYGMYFISCIRLYIKGRFNNYYAQVGIAIFIGTMAYMVAGISNDSSITTAPVFWTLIGLGIVVNHKAKPLILEEIITLKAAKAKKKEARLEHENNSVDTK